MRRDVAKQGIASGMAQRVVDDLEIVEVDVNNHQPRVIASPRQSMVELFDEQFAVGKIGEAVVQCHMGNLTLALLDCRNHIVKARADPLLPQISLGVEHKRNQDTPVALAVGAAHGAGTDFTLSATKLFLSHSILVNATARLTKANQAGLLGFGTAGADDHSLQFEGSVAYQLSRRAVLGAEYRSKPDNLAIAREDDWWDLFAAYALTRNLTVTAAYVDLGSIATFDKQRGGLLSAQLAF